MPDDKTLATILAICDLMGNKGTTVQAAVAAYDKGLKEVLRYRKSEQLPEMGGYPQE
jgi:hypothetical protein